MIAITRVREDVECARSRSFDRARFFNVRKERIRYGPPAAKREWKETTVACPKLGKGADNRSWKKGSNMIWD